MKKTISCKQTPKIVLNSVPLQIDMAMNLNHATNSTFSLIADIPYLRSLHLDRNPLQKVEANAFEMIPQLVSLDLSHCNIKRVAARAFAQLTSLEKLFLQHNQISELRQKTVESITGEQKPLGYRAPTMG